MADPQRVRSIFLEAVERHAPDQWSSFLDRACGEDSELRNRVEVLLRAHHQANSILDVAAVPPVLSIDQPTTETAGTVIGPYRLLQQIGEGGMGTVWMAQQTEPVKRVVALKLIKAGMDSAQVIARFEAERQALALMDHPNIATVLDAGTTGVVVSGQCPVVCDEQYAGKPLATDHGSLATIGRPYFVMELVTGPPITDYCDQNQLTPGQRLELFVHLCQAVQHAHLKGIIHRDIKPSNVLITLLDGAPVVKVIDFGIAKAISQQLTDKTLFTNCAQMVGTPLYMSPEQASMTGLDIDTRSDIYSLGVLLYELLTGATPFAKERFEEVAYDEIRRIIREEEPPKPSTRLSELSRVGSAHHASPDGGQSPPYNSGLASVSALRQTEPAKLTKLVRGELDWIVMRCLEKDRDRRYETASALAADIQRYLNDEPVQACPPSAGYRLRKFVRRRKHALATVALLSLALLIAVGAVAGSLGWLARDRAARRLVVSQSVDRALEEGKQWQEQEKWREALAAVTRAEVVSADDADYEELRERVRQARRDIEMVLRLEGILFDLTGLKQDPLRFDFEKPDFEYSQAYRDYGIDVDVLDREAAAALIRSRPIRLQLALGLDSWAETRRYAGRPSRPTSTNWQDLLALAAAADPEPWRCQVREALRHRSQGTLLKVASEIPIGDVPPVTLGLLGRALNDAGAAQQAEALFRRAQRLHPNSFWLNFDLAMACLRQQPVHGTETVRFFSVALALRPDSVNARAHLGFALLQFGKQEEAMAEFRASIDLNPKSASAWINRGNAYHGLHQYDQAVADFSKAIELDPTYALAWIHRGNSYHDARQYDKAIADHGKAIALDPANWWARLCRGIAFCDLRRYDRAIADYSKAIELAPQHAANWHHRGNANHNLRQYDQAIADFSKALELDPKNATTWSYRGNAYHDAHRYDKAIADHSEALALDPKNSWAWMCRGIAYCDSHRYDQAVADYSKVIELAPKDASAHSNLAWLLATCADLKFRNPSRAVELGEKAVQLGPDTGNNWNTLGAARYRAGAWDAAIAALDKSMKLRNGGDSFDWFFLAMAHWRLGEKALAHQRFDQAVQWMEKNKPQDDELRRFRAEAAVLLGLTARQEGNVLKKKENK